MGYFELALTGLTPAAGEAEEAKPVEAKLTSDEEKELNAE